MALKTSPSIQIALMDHKEAFNKLNSEHFFMLEKSADLCVEAIKSGGKIFFIGNGGSCADAQHLAAELIVRLTPDKNRNAIPALALTADTAVLTACSNDYGYDKIFSRQLEGLALKDVDVVVYLSTSGQSENLMQAMYVSRNLGLLNIVFTGDAYNPLGNMASLWFKAPSIKAAAIQEIHIWAGHVLCSLIEEKLNK